MEAMGSDPVAHLVFSTSIECPLSEAPPLLTNVVRDTGILHYPQSIYSIHHIVPLQQYWKLRIRGTPATHIVIDIC